MIIRPSAIPKGIGLNITVDWAPKSWGVEPGTGEGQPSVHRDLTPGPPSTARRLAQAS
jgi:hypothetical protein